MVFSSSHMDECAGYRFFKKMACQWGWWVVFYICNASEQYLKLAEQFDDGVSDELRTREKTREKIVQIIINNPNVTTSELAEQLELTVKGIEWQLKQLKEHNIIRCVGAEKGGYWEIIK